MYLKISNKGEVDPQAFTLLGASSKRGDSGKIGMFGSGTKYALAYFLRSNIDIKVFSGEKQVSIVTKSKKFRDNEFDVICVDGKETSITTQSGPKWKLWQSIREIYSNAIDEGLIEMKSVSECYGNSGETNFFIEMNLDVRDFYNRVDEYFATDKTVIYSNGEGSIYSKINADTLIYRKGIKCFETSTPSLYDYDFNNIEINESRIVMDSDHVYTNVAKLLYPCNVETVIENFYATVGKGCIEMNINSGWVTTKSELLSDTWLKCLPTKYVAPSGTEIFLQPHELEETTILPAKIYFDFLKRFGDEHKTPALRKSSKGNFYRSASPTPLQIEILRQVLEFFNAVNYEINYSIDIVIFDNPSIHGRVEDGKILINQVAFEQGKTWIANIIIEEHIHIKHAVKDCTRKFQDAAIGELLTYMQEATTIVL